MRTRESKSKRYPCPECGSSDGMAKYDDGTYCFACQHSTGTGDIVKATYLSVEKEIKESMDTSHLKTLAIPERKISQQTVEKYGVGIKVNETNTPVAHYYPLYNKHQKPIGHIVRNLPKSFRVDPSGVGVQHQSMFFGQNVFPPGSGKYITVTEGHLDAMAAYEMQGSKFPVVSINNGVDNAVSEFKRNLEYLESFERVYVCFDNDPAGRKAALIVCCLLSPGKAYRVHLDEKLKDPCGYKIAGKYEEFTKIWWQAQMFMPAGIVSSSTLKDRIRNRPATPGIAYPYSGLNNLTYGIRKGEAVIITAPTGVGKTTFLRETMYNILKEDENAKIGTMFLEETVEESGLGLMSMEASIPFHIPDAEYTDEDYDAAEKILADDRVFFFDHFGSNRIDDIISRIRYYAKGLDCSYIFLDHLSIIVSDQQQGDERKLLDSIMTRLKTITVELSVALIAVVHTNRQGLIRGTAGIEQLANIVIKLDRDIEAEDAEDRRTMRAVVAKNRFSGKTGPAFSAKYNELTGRLEEISEDSWVPTDEDLTQCFDGAILDSIEEEEDG